METYLLEIITPVSVAFSDQIEMVTAPSASGVIGVLPHHVPLFTRLNEGEVKITKSGEEYYLAIGGGFMEVTPHKVVILATEAFHTKELNEQEVLAGKKRAEDALAAKPSGPALIEAQSLFRRSTIALKLINRHRRTASRSSSISMS